MADDTFPPGSKAALSLLRFCEEELEKLKAADPLVFHSFLLPPRLWTDLENGGLSFAQMDQLYETFAATNLTAEERRKALVDCLDFTAFHSEPPNPVVEPSLYRPPYIDIQQEFKYLHAAWTAPFIDNDTTQSFFNHLNNIGLSVDEQEKTSIVLYARVVPLVQSSGSGKSRMLDEAAKHFLAIPICLRPSRTANGYPKGDVEIFNVLCKPRFMDFSKTARWLAFFMALLQTALHKMKVHLGHYLNSTVLAEKWREWLETGDNRKEFYIEVTDRTIQFHQTPDPYRNNLASYRQHIVMVRKLWGELAKLVEGHHFRPILLYFDEAHELDDGATLYWLSSVLADINTPAISDSENPRIPPHVVVITSTQSNLSRLAPVAGSARSNMTEPLSHQWGRITPKQLPNPWCSLSRHIFWHLGAKKAYEFTPAEVRKFERIVELGRPLWATTYNTRKNADETIHERKTKIISLARNKICLHNEKNATAVALICRLGLVIDHMAAGGDFVSDIVGKSAATATYIHPSRQYMAASYPLDPILGQGSAAHLRGTQHEDFQNAFRYLFGDAKVGKGIGGEVLTKFMLMRSYDLAYQLTGSELDDPLQPVTLQHLLQCLLSPTSVTNLVELTKSYNEGFNDCSLQTYAKSTTVLSQWLPAANISAVEDLEGLAAAVHYQTGVEGSLCLPAIDGFLVFTIDDDKPLQASNMLILCFQTKNQKSQPITPPNTNNLIKKWLSMGIAVLYIQHDAVVRTGQLQVYLNGERLLSIGTMVVQPEHNKRLESAETGQSQGPKRQRKDSYQPTADIPKRINIENAKAPLFYLRINGINPTIVQEDDVIFLTKCQESAFPQAPTAELDTIKQTGFFVDLPDNLELPRKTPKKKA